MYSAIDALLIEGGWPVIYYWLRQRIAIDRRRMRPPAKAENAASQTLHVPTTTIDSTTYDGIKPGSLDT
jgi:hypothetical protein